MATVQGDIHDIGKNLFGILLRVSGFTVHDLGEDTPPEAVAEEVSRIQPDIVALSGLVTISYESMERTIQLIRQLEDKDLARTPVIIGGGTISEMVSSFVGSDYWATDAMYGVQLCKQIMEGKE